MKLSRRVLILTLLLMTTRLLKGQGDPKEKEDDDGTIQWVYLSNSPYADTKYPLDHEINADSCIDRDRLHIETTKLNLKVSRGIWYQVDENAAFDNTDVENITFWMEAKELDPAIPDVLPQEGRSFCLSGKHYKNSLEMFDHMNFRSMKELAESEFDIGSHLYPNDYSQMNFYRPNESNYRRTKFDRQRITGYQDVVPNYIRGKYLPERESLYPNFFWIKWKEADDTFFHIRRTFLKYLGNPKENNPGDNDPGSRILTSFPGATVRDKDPNPLYLYRPAIPQHQPHPRCKNPYFVEITEIHIDGVRLHNWLHITVYIRKENVVPGRNCATGIMKFIMLEVRDSMGLPIGDFNTDFPCGASCNCKSPFCQMVKSKKQHAMPCMFTPTRAVTHPGLFMYGNPEGFNEVHATWHFAQHSSYFATELHFAALIVEDSKKLKFYNGRRTKYRNPRRCVGVPQPFTWACKEQKNGMIPEPDLEVKPKQDPANPFDNINATFLKPDWHDRCSVQLQDEDLMQYYNTTATRKVDGWAGTWESPHWRQPWEACHEYKKLTKKRKMFLWAWGYPFTSIRYLKPHPCCTYGLRCCEWLSKLPMLTYSDDECKDPKTGYPINQNTNPHDMTHHKWFYSNFDDTKAESDPFRPEEYYEWSLQHLRKDPRPYGWNAQYTVLKPTLLTLGGWDYFKMNKLIDPEQINCHKRLSSEHYEKDIKQTLKGRLPLRRNFYGFKRGYELGDRSLQNLSYRLQFVNVSTVHNPKVAHEWATELDTSDYETVYSLLPLEINVTNPADKVGKMIRMNRVYFGTLGTKLAYEDQRGVPKEKLEPHNMGYDMAFAESPIGKYFLGLPTVQQIAVDERCACPAFGTTQPTNMRTERIEVLQGRSAHATQMLLAWIVMIPIGLFVARYYKETYNRVYILEEFWWYTTHLLCMGTAFVFMLGGIYAIEVKHITRAKFETWSEETKAHVLLGGSTIALFGIQLVLAPFRAWIIDHRIINIMMHFLVGMSNYVLGIVTTLIAVAIPQSRMSCWAFYMYLAFLGFQAVMYLFMEIHMRHVDRLLMLFPPRTYLPPPVVRVFHTNAPLSQLRLYILVFYVSMCWMFFFIIRYGAIELFVASCFANLGNDYEEDA